jgi:PPOX class probable F420-dependent enzyme
MSAANTTNGPIIPADYLDLLDTRVVANVATIGPGGAPQVSPVWFGWDGAHIRISHLPNAQKLKNLRRDNRVSLAIVDPANDHRYLEVRGRAIAFEDDPEYSCLSALSQKYLGVTPYPYMEDGVVPVVITIEPTGTSQMHMSPTPPEKP